MVVTSFAYFPSKRSVEVVLRVLPCKGLGVARDQCVVSRY